MFFPLARHVFLDTLCSQFLTRFLFPLMYRVLDQKHNTERVAPRKLDINFAPDGREEHRESSTIYMPQSLNCNAFVDDEAQHNADQMQNKGKC